MDAYDCRALACVPSFPIIFFATSHLYSILSPPHRNKETMMGRMDDQMDGWMDDETDEMMFHNVLYYM
jgi:hypothetical protein